MVYLPTFTIHINQMYVNMHNIPYMDPMGVYIYIIIYIYNFCPKSIEVPPCGDCRVARSVPSTSSSQTLCLHETGDVKSLEVQQIPNKINHTFPSVHGRNLANQLIW